MFAEYEFKKQSGKRALVSPRDCTVGPQRTKRDLTDLLISLFHQGALGRALII